MIKYEMKKVFLKTGSKIALLLLLAALSITCFFAMNVSYVDENGKTKSGPAAVLALKEAQKEWAGELNEEKIEKVIAENHRIRTSPEALSQDIKDNDIAYSRGQGIREIRSLLNCAYAVTFREYDYYRADTLSTDDAKDFYKNRTKLLKEWLEGEDGEQFSAEEQAYLIRQYENLKTPLSFDYMTGWQQLFEFSPTIVMLITLVAGYLVSGIFSNEFLWKSDAILFSSAYGRNKAVAAKIAAGFLVVTVLYFAAFLTYAGVVLGYLGIDGWNLQIQSSWTSWKSFYNITNFEQFFLIGIGGYIGCLFLCFLSMLVSAKTRSSVFAVMVPFELIFLPSFLSNIKSTRLNKVLGLLPDQLLQIANALKYFNLYSIGENVIGEVPVVIVLYIIGTLLILPVLYEVYRRVQIN